jgi:mRNA-degrading endonuclease YafQ of YafQ-DinJ toxin-antitoxin module
MKILYKPSFIRDLNKLSSELQEEAIAKIELFRDTTNHLQLKVHKLKGKLKNKYSFSFTYSHRIVFEYESKNQIVLIAIGTHDVYR